MAEIVGVSAGSHRGYRNPVTLRAHLATLSVEELRRLGLSNSLEEFQAHEKRFWEKVAPAPRIRADGKTQLPTQAFRVNTVLHQRLAVGLAYQKWLETPEGLAAVKRRTQRRAFLVAGTERLESDVTKAETERLARSWQLALQQELQEGRIDEEKKPEQVRWPKHSSRKAWQRERRGGKGRKQQQP